MQHLSATLIIALVIIVHQGGGQVVKVQQDWDQIAQESRPTRTGITIVDGPKYVTVKPNQTSQSPEVTQKQKSETTRTPSKLSLNAKPSVNPNTQNKQVKYENTPPRSVYYSQQIFNSPPRPYKTKPSHMKQPNGSYKYPKVIPLSGHHKIQYYSHPSSVPPRQSSLAYSASSGKPVYIKATSPKFSLPVQTINGIRSSDLKPQKLRYNTTTTSTTTTTVRPLRNKRIWPKHILNKTNGTITHNDSLFANNLLTNDTETANSTDHETSASTLYRRYATRIFNTTTERIPTESTTRVYRRVTRIPKHKTKTSQPSNNLTSQFKQNDWIPIVPSHYPNMRRQIPKNRRSDMQLISNNETPAQDRRMLYLHSVGLIPIQRLNSMPVVGNKKMIFFRTRKRQLNPNIIHSGYSRKPRSRPNRVIYGDLHTEESRPRMVTKVKHHHHHHHHKYIKTVEKPVKVPVKVIVPKPYPVPVEKRIPYPVEKIKVVEKKVPYPVPVEKKVPYPVQVRVPQPYPVKVVEKEYIPKPYPVVQHVPVIQHVKVPHPVPVTVEKKVPYPVHVKVNVPVDRPYAVPVTVEKKVHVPVPVRVYVPQPYAVETKVPYPVEVKVKEPVEVIRHVRVPVQVPIPHPVAIKVPQPVPVTVEKKVPYPVEVEKKVPVPFRIYVPQPVEVEKKVPVYIPKPYPVEKKVPVPFKVPVPYKVPVKVPVEVPVQVPIYIGQVSPVHQSYFSSVTKSPFEAIVATGFTVSDVTGTQSPQHTVTVHGNGAFAGFSDRSDTTTPNPAAA